MIVLALVFVGPRGRDRIDLRMQDTVGTEDWLTGRVDLNAATLAMVRDYPLLGVGLGCWPELFSHYQAPPWLDMIYREAHDDYAQLIAETGVVGFGLIVCCFALIGRQFYRAIAKNREISPALAALSAALMAMAFHEIFDFSLQTPANALLFTVLLALATRMVMRPAPVSRTDGTQTNWKPRVTAVGVSAIAALLIMRALRQGSTPYPYDIKEPKSVAAAVALISAHPAESSPHLDLVSLAGESLSTEARLKEMRAAVWLDPNDPYAKDDYALALFDQKMTAQALDQIRRSVMVSPALSTHPYLGQSSIPRLTDQAKNAVERGFAEAIERRYAGAVQGLADFYIALGRLADAGDTYRQAAQREGDSDTGENYLLRGGRTYAQAGHMEHARELFDRAIRNQPAEARPYVDETTLVLAPQHELKAAERLVAQGVQAGADPSYCTGLWPERQKRMATQR